MHYSANLPREPVTSSAVRSAAYDADEWVLQVKYVNGQVYNYFRVPPLEYERFLEAPSKGAHMNREIKPYYEYELMEAEETSAA
ncbi:KTSC domain-containing protein [Caenimonas aquaedulcis]|uniref:KTSC domain-containing protein n=1 Tax=Caenimonas aquaedulcis TaxID=2793270 RepID=A0A931H242_9BURK|nr:KTSC domain-containing protein [Caenimonas aquaedulcis]MBG9387148.1 KTSC domain-containing protein [Caenimonas aquaedulcis]